MKVNHIFDKGVAKESEDSFVISGNLFGVFDGATSVDKYEDENGHTGAYLAAKIAKEIFEKNDKPLTELAKEANSRIREAMMAKNIDITRRTSWWCTTAAVVRIDDDHFHWVQVGDSLILVINNDGAHKLMVEDYDHDHEALVKWKELADKKEENIKEKVQDINTKARNEACVKWGVLCGDEKMSKFVQSGTVALKDVKHIILFTDGLLIPKEDPDAREDFDIFVKLFLEGGLEKVKNYIREIEKTDPNCWKYPRFKQHDDIAAISLSF